MTALPPNAILRAIVCFSLCVYSVTPALDAKSTDANSIGDGGYPASATTRRPLNGNCTTQYQFQCDNGNCVPVSWVCDNENDCGDNSDELVDCSLTLNLNCSSTEFSCVAGGCVPNRWKCDGEEDCHDGSDEDRSLCSASCDENKWRCKDGNCIPLSWLCDNKTDCSGGEDERVDCTHECAFNQHRCADSGACISAQWLCDGDADCEDGSDEVDCPKRPCDSRFEFACASDGVCVSSLRRCNGIADCADSSDESGCERELSVRNVGGRVCGDDEFACSDGVSCLHKLWACDGEVDCPDRSDEDPARCGSGVSAKPACDAGTEFRCDDGDCIPLHLRCSGTSECVDGSDEARCLPGEVRRPCDAEDEFPCGDGSCISTNLICDGRLDCPGGEDEPFGECSVSECPRNHSCEQICIGGNSGYHCGCNFGYSKLNSTHCQDINECNRFGACSQMCTNFDGGFKCECEAGYERDFLDKTRCKSTEGHASLLFAHRRDIRKLELSHHDLTMIRNDTESACALDYNFRTGIIYWSDTTRKRIYGSPIDEIDNNQVVFDRSVVTADGLAVDWVHKHLYWTDTGENTLSVSDLEGAMRSTLVRDDLAKPRAITVHPIRAVIFWTDWGREAKIERAALDGSQREVIVKAGVRWPNGLSIDFVLERLYWVDAKLHQIACSDFFGEGRKVILKSPHAHLVHPFSVTVFEDSVFWSDWERRAIYRADKFNGSGVTSLTTNSKFDQPMTVHVYHLNRQPDGPNLCLPINGGCSHFCFSRPRLSRKSEPESTEEVRGPTICACPDGMVMDPNGLKCSEVKGSGDIYLEKLGDDSGSSPASLALALSGLAFFFLFLSLLALYKHCRRSRRGADDGKFGENPIYRSTTERPGDPSSGWSRKERVAGATPEETGLFLSASTVTNVESGIPRSNHRGTEVEMIGTASSEEERQTFLVHSQKDGHADGCD